MFYASGSQTLPHEDERLHEVFSVGSVDTFISNYIHFKLLLTNNGGRPILTISVNVT